MLIVPPESGAEYTTVVPLRTVTVPVGVPEPGATALTVTVAVTDWPETEVAGEILTVVAVEDLLTA